MDDELYNDINTLLTYLNASGFCVVEILDRHYLKFGNSAPGELLRQKIDKLQARLNKGREEIVDTPLSKQLMDGFSDCIREKKTVSTFVKTEDGIVRVNYSYMTNEQMDKAWGVTKASVLRESSKRGD